MKPELWRQVEDIFHRALELDESRRAEFVQRSCGEDEQLRQEVQSLLSEDKEAGQFIDSPVLELVGRLIANHHDEKQLSDSSSTLDLAATSGAIIDRYHLLQKIGEGGMGEVWLAEQKEPVRRRVALKLVKAGMNTREVMLRFESERQALALMDHPAIARVFDAGSTPQGAPYFVMEYVAGVPITAYCDNHKLSIRERLELFMHLCEGVQHAHQKAIIHRDLKPSNILVVEVDGEAAPKIIDFGVAKALTQGLTEETMFTRVGSLLGTPEYMSPEQAHSSGEDIDTRTDVYSLGVVLYILLAASLPFDPKEWKNKPLDEMLRRLREEDPPRPSTRLITDRDTSSATAEARATEPKQLVSVLRGDLDCITMKAVEKERSRRYASPSDFAADIKRYLNHEAVLAVPPSLGYRTTKFLRRNRTAVAFSAAALVLVVGSLSTGLFIANRERKVAEQRFAQVRQLANKFIALDEDIRGLPGSTKVRMQLVSDAQQYLTSLGGDVHRNKDLALEIAYAYVRVAHAQGDPTSPNLGQFSEADGSLNKASTFVDPVLLKDPGDPRALFIATTISHDRMNLADSRGDQEEAVKAAAVTAALIERFMKTHPVEFRDLYSMRYFYVNVAGSYDDARHFDYTIRYCQRALEIQIPGRDANAFRGGALGILSDARWQLGDLNGALNTRREANELEKAEAAGGHASLRINLASGYQVEGTILGQADAEASLERSREALASFQKALDIAEDLAQKDASDYLSRDNLATSSLEVGNILRHRDPQGALAVYDHGLMRVREVKSNISMQRDETELLSASSYPLRWLGRERDAKQRIDGAFELLRQAKLYPVDKVEPMSDTYNALRARADDYAQTGQTSAAIEAYQQLLNQLMAWKPDLQNDLRDATCISRTWTALADLLRQAGRAEEADRLVAQRNQLWNQWNSKLPNAQFLLRQSLSQIAPHARSPVVSKR